MVKKKRLSVIYLKILKKKMIKKIQFKTRSYSSKIIIKNNYIKKYIVNLLKENKTVYCVVDKKLKYLTNKIKKEKINFIYLKCGEEIKNIKSYNNLCEILLCKKINRNSILVSLGGGTLGDLCGFVASTILRGISFRLIPTTLLSQVDSSIGGKNGINSKYGKNLIGTFYQPEEIVIDTSSLKTLPYREIKSGYAEILKHALINDNIFFKWLENNYKKLFELDKNILEKAIYKSIMIKLKYVNNDPLEKLTNSNSRGMLNFGHTIGHALEAFYKYSKLNHGEAISIGMIIESKISNKLGYLSDKSLEMILIHFKKTKLKNSDKNINNKNILENISKDKKNTFSKINIVLIKDIGKSFFKRNMKLIQIKNILKEI